MPPSLAEKHFSSNLYTYDHWTFGSVRHLEESSRGDWTFQVTDLVSKDVGTFQEWNLRLYGHRTTPVMAPIFKLLLN